MPGFFDKMKAVAGDKVIEASIRSKQALEAQQVKGKIGELQGQKKSALFELGSSLYNMYSSGSLDQASLDAQCQAIAGIDVQIKEKEEELAEVHRRAEELLAEQRGADEKAAAAHACSECGTRYEGSPKFCPNCGRKLA